MLHAIVRRSTLLTQLASSIWGFAEPAFHEVRSARAQRALLASESFRITEGIGGMPTAFLAEFGTGSPVIALLGEYDALPSLSQEIAAVRAPIPGADYGHGCGHNLIAPGSIGAALAVKDAIASGSIRGTIRYYACPAEESGSGKGFIVRDGAFDGVDAALSWHPEPISRVVSFSLQAVLCVCFNFEGVPAHAAAAPEAGRSALDAVELMNVGCNYLREHIPHNECFHYIITNGGTAANIVPSSASVLYMIRAPKAAQVLRLRDRIKDCARGAALMTGTNFNVRITSGSNGLVNNIVLEDLLYEKMLEAGAPAFDAQDEAFAAALAATLTESREISIRHLLSNTGHDWSGEYLFSALLSPSIDRGVCFPGSTDLGDVSRVVPLAHFNIACSPIGTQGHTWQNTAACGSSIGMKGMLKAAEILALSALALFKDPALLSAAKTEFEERTQGDAWQPLLPEALQPPLV